MFKDSKEQRFFNILRDMFIGAKVEGVGGFVNLMKIKSKYYEKIEQLLEKDIDEALKKYPRFREELFDKLYTFFKRYFTESGSICFNSTPFHNNIYEKIYTDSRDVILFWKTRMLYYVKTDRVFRSMSVEFDGKKFYFDASEIELKKANEKKELIYELKEISDDGIIHFKVVYSEKGKKTKIDEILKQIRNIRKKDNAKLNITEEDIKRAIRVFEKQSEVDYFINKNAREFLREQFDLWLYQYLTNPEAEWSVERIEQIQILKRIAYKLIDFISQFEDELVKIWNKPKFVKNSNYVITLDRIAKKNGWHVIEKLQKHSGWQEQVREWIELGMIESEPDILIEEKNTGKELNKKYQF
ncbi:MAG: site-specific DNA-methyltransferase, partial [bacterium]|nr:site-specific DNA-methyltransferase [bacterium]